MSKYSVGLRNVGSYMVSGEPYVARKSVNSSGEIKIEFPYVTKNIKIRIPSPPNNGTMIRETPGQTNNAVWWWKFNFGDPGFGGSVVGTLPQYGGANDFTYNCWFKQKQGGTNDIIFGFYGSTATGANGLRMWFRKNSNTELIGYLKDAGNGDVNNQAAADFNTGNLTINNISTDWNQLLITQLTGSTHFYINGSLATKTTGRTILASDNVQKGWNAPGRTPPTASYDEEMLWNVGMNSDQVATLYNNGEWVNPNDLSRIKDNLVGWWTYGDDPNGRYVGTMPVADPLHNIFLNQATGTSLSSSATVGISRYNFHEIIEYTEGPFAKQSTGKIRISGTESLTSAIHFPDDDSNNAVDNYVSIPNFGGASYDLSTNSFTISTWLKMPPGTIPAGGLTRFMGQIINPVFGRIRRSNSGDLNDVFVRFQLCGADVNFGDNPSPLTISDDKWHNLVIVFDTANSKLIVYVDGVLKGEDTMTAGGFIDNWLFPSNGAANNWAEITQWDAALSADQVVELYDGGYAKDPTKLSIGRDLRSWYRFNPTLFPADNSTIIYDRQGNNDATIISGSNPANSYFVEGPLASKVVPNKHYYELQGYGSSIDLPMKTKEIYISGVNSQTTVEVIAELTNIPVSNMYELSGSGINE